MKRKIKSIINRLISLMVIFYLFSPVNAIADSQEVYLAEEPLPKIAARLAKEGMSQKQIIEHLKKTLPRVTPDLAKAKFGIDWIDNDLQPFASLSSDSYYFTYDADNFYFTSDDDQLRFFANLEIKKNYTYPAVAICKMNSTVGYGLFAMTDIKEKDIIAEYTGTHIKDQRLLDTIYMADLDDIHGVEKINAKYAGNASRFALHLLGASDLESYNYEMPGWFGYRAMTTSDIADANSIILTNLGTPKDKRAGLMAIRDIKTFEQIGFSYNSLYGYEHTQWHEEPELFDKKGNVIIKDKYRIKLRGICLVDKTFNKYTLFPPATEEKIKDMAKLVEVIDDYMIIKGGFSQDAKEIQIMIVNVNDWNTQIAKPRNRLSIPCHYITDDKNKNQHYSHKKIKTFIEFLKKIKEYNIYSNDELNILQAVREERNEDASLIVEKYKHILNASRKDANEDASLEDRQYYTVNG